MGALEAANFTQELGLELAIVQAGMAGGVAGGELAGAVSAAGGLGTVGMMAPGAFASALADASRRARGRPVAANLLVPFARDAHLRACAEAGVALVVLHGGMSEHGRGPWRRWIARARARGLRTFATVGTVPQAKAALEAGASGLVVQGREAGGHLVGVAPVREVLPAVIEAAFGAPVLAAGGVAERSDVRALLDLGAVGVVAGTRFVVSDESGAHPLYKQRVLAATRTLETLLFSFGWPMRHRVIPNAATKRWCSRRELGPSAVVLAGRATAPLGRLAPLGAMGAIAALQRPWLPLFTPALPLAGMPESTLECSAMYAGESALRVNQALPAERVLAELAPA